MMERLARDAAKGDKIALAQVQFFSYDWLLAVRGMPLMRLRNEFRDDDEDDFEAAFRKLVGEGIYGGSNERLGVDVANRISMNSLLYRKPIVDKEQDGVVDFIEQLGGPF